jgi:dTDP-4-amino-4,6-dideoxygalactose transaminase
MQVPLVDLRAQYIGIKNEIDKAISNVISNGNFILGSEVKHFEEEIAAYCGASHAIGVASGTDALHLALLACGAGQGDEVITTPFTFIATAEAITKCGATPVFVDIDPETYNIEPRNIESKITARTKVILPVHLYGQPANMHYILELAEKYNLKVIEDCAQALGAKYNGRRVGSLGDVGCLSFFPSKVLGAYGDGGVVLTNNAETAETVDILRNHGCKHKYYHLIHGFNSRLDSLQAAILRVKLRHLDNWIARRRENAFLYSELLSEVEGIEPLSVLSGSYHIFNYYTVRIKGTAVNRDELQQHLTSQGIATAIYYPVSLHLQPVYKYLGYQQGDLPESEGAQQEVLSLPMFPELQPDQVTRIVEIIKRVLNRVAK